MPLSKKKETELYNSIHEEIMDARVKINMKFKTNGGTIAFNEIDDIMSNLNTQCPQKALQVFKPKN